jgi:hypothetical protein
MENNRNHGTFFNSDKSLWMEETIHTFIVSYNRMASGINP